MFSDGGSPSVVFLTLTAMVQHFSIISDCVLEMPFLVQEEDNL